MSAWFILSITEYMQARCEACESLSETTRRLYPEYVCLRYLLPPMMEPSGPAMVQIPWPDPRLKLQPTTSCNACTRKTSSLPLVPSFSLQLREPSLLRRPVVAFSPSDIRPSQTLVQSCALDVNDHWRIRGLDSPTYPEFVLRSRR